FRSGVSAGMLSVNNSTSGAEAHLPFGGNGRSGNGSRQSGIWVLDQFTRWQAMNWDYSGRLQKAQMDVQTVEPDYDYRLAHRSKRGLPGHVRASRRRPLPGPAGRERRRMPARISGPGHARVRLTRDVLHRGPPGGVQASGDHTACQAEADAAQG